MIIDAGRKLWGDALPASTAGRHDRKVALGQIKKTQTLLDDAGHLLHMLHEKFPTVSPR